MERDEIGIHAMSGPSVKWIRRDRVAQVIVHNPGKFNAMSRSMWRELRAAFEHIHNDADVRCVLLRGDGGNFCAGGDISEYPSFRFDPGSLQEFHEADVWGALQAMLDCDVPIVAQLQGHCMGAGLEMACCCDLRIAGTSARFGAPIAHLGFPMAPREAQLVARELGLATAREVLLSAAVLSAPVMLQRGFLHQLHDDSDLATITLAAAQRIATLAPQAARLNKQTLRSLCAPAVALNGDPFAQHAMVPLGQGAYRYADSAEHREGIQAFIQKRSPVF